MTREEIINKIKPILEELSYPDAVSYLTQNDVKWLKENIKALEQEPCEDCISREDILNHQYTIDESEALGISTRNVVNVDDILNAKPVQPKSKTGRWIAYEVRLPDRTILNYRCSVCGRKLIGYNTETLSEAPFCHCGCRMIEPQESEG